MRSPPPDRPEFPPRSRAEEDYLKAIYKLGGEAEPVSTSALAADLDRSAASVTNMVKSLAEQGLLEHTPYRGVRLTPPGELTALRIIRRHRVLELYLIEKLGYGWEDVHREAERLEHAASDDLIDRMATALGEPSFDPHGAPIPTREGAIDAPATVSLTELDTGTEGVVREVSDESAEGLRKLAEVGLFPGTSVRVLDGGGPEDVRLAIEGETRRISRPLAERVFIQLRAADAD